MPTPENTYCGCELGTGGDDAGVEAVPILTPGHSLCQVFLRHVLLQARNVGFRSHSAHQSLNLHNLAKAKPRLPPCQPQPSSGPITVTGLHSWWQDEQPVANPPLALRASAGVLCLTRVWRERRRGCACSRGLILLSEADGDHPGPRDSSEAITHQHCPSYLWPRSAQAGGGEWDSARELPQHHQLPCTSPM